MANWKELNARLDEVLDNLSDTEWQEWEAARLANKEMRRRELKLKAKIHAQKVLAQNFKTTHLFNQTLATLVGSSVVNNISPDTMSAGESNYAMAA